MSDTQVLSVADIEQRREWVREGDEIDTAPFLDVDVLDSHEELRRQRVELESIVRDLAAHDPAPKSNAYYCSMCGEETADDISLHTDGCAFARAVMWVSAHPVSGTEGS